MSSLPGYLHRNLIGAANLADMPAQHCFSTTLHTKLGKDDISVRMCGLRQTPVLQPFPDLTDAATAFPQYTQPGIDPRRVMRLENVYLQARGCTLRICAAG